MTTPEDISELAQNAARTTLFVGLIAGVGAIITSKMDSQSYFRAFKIAQNTFEAIGVFCCMFDVGIYLAARSKGYPFETGRLEWRNPRFQSMLLLLTNTIIRTTIHFTT